MAVRAGTLTWTTTGERRRPGATSLASLPAETLAGVFENRVEALGTALALSKDAGAEVWLETGAIAAEAIDGARAARPLLRRIVEGLGDEEALAGEVVRFAEAGSSVVIVKGGSEAQIQRLEAASHVYRFGRWTARAVR